MKGNLGYDEVMIVNPYDTRSNNQKQVNLMRYEQLPPEMGYYSEPAGYGYYAEPQDGYYGEHPDMGYYGEPAGYYADEYPSHPMGWYGNPEMVGYGTYEPLGESEQGVGYYGEPDIAGYVRETRSPRYNPGCPVPTNVAGFADADQLAGYQKPATVNPSCGQFTPPPGPSTELPETFRPLW